LRRSLFVLLLLAVPTLTACGGETATAPGVATVAPAEAHSVLRDAPDGLVVLDVRAPEEFAEARIAGAVNIDFYAADFADRIGALDRDVPYVMYCRSGNRSGQTADLMRDLGFTEVYDVQGGIVSWAEAGLPVER
jgi:rhodanese-related sulfurtransferase